MMNNEIVIIAGPNGVGKKTFAKEFIRGRKGFEFLNSDEIAIELSPGDPSSKAIAAGKSFFRKLQEALENGRSVLIESTLAGRFLIKLISQARSKGYRVSIIFLFTDSASILVERIRNRVAKGGHDVPAADVIRRLERRRRNFIRNYKDLVDSWTLIYNTEGRFIDVAMRDNGEEQIFDEGLFARFVNL